MSTTTSAPTLAELTELVAAVEAAQAVDAAAAKPCRRCQGKGSSACWLPSFGDCFRCNRTGIDPTKAKPAADRLAAATVAWLQTSGHVRAIARFEGATGDRLGVDIRNVAQALQHQALADAGVYTNTDHIWGAWLDTMPLATKVVEAIVSGRQTKALRPETLEALKAERIAARRARAEA